MGVGRFKLILVFQYPPSQIRAMLKPKQKIDISEVVFLLLVITLSLVGLAVICKEVIWIASNP